MRRLKFARNISFFNFCNLRMGRAIAVLSFFHFISSNILSNKDITYFLKGSNKKIIDGFGELVINFCTLPDRKQSERDQIYLRKFRKALLIIADKGSSYALRRDCLSRNPRLVRKLSELAVKNLLDGKIRSNFRR